MQNPEDEVDPYRIARLILELRQNGVTDTVLLNALERIPREAFVPDALSAHAYDDVALPIACGQTISRPITAVSMVNALELGEDKSLTVLEIGTGSGYMSALISKLARRVYTLDRYRTLIDAARARFNALEIQNIISQWADGAKGWPETAPFDRILSTCALEAPSDVWLSQLKPGGMLIMPIGTNEAQFVIRIRKSVDGILTEEKIAPSKFLHLAEGVSKQL